jgi:regulation of enolase protein 1 (concanavalin A-like superfamily)
MKRTIFIQILFTLFISFTSLYAQWAKTYGGSDNENAWSIQQTSDGGYITAGYTESFGAGGRDIWVLKLDSNGTIEWQKTYGGIYNELANFIQQTSDGGYIVAGISFSFGAGYSDTSDIWILKLDSEGDMEWQRTYGGSNSDNGHFIQQTSDGGYIVSGCTYSFGNGSNDGWILKLTSTGDIEWQHSFGGWGYDSASSIQETNDAGYIIAGYTYSSGAGYDIWILKLDSEGDMKWQRTYGGSNGDFPHFVQQTSDEGYIVSGCTFSFGNGSRDGLIIKLTSTGDIEWQHSYGGSDSDCVHSIQQTSNGGYIAEGFTDSFGAGSKDIWILKLDST